MARRAAREAASKGKKEGARGHTGTSLVPTPVPTKASSLRSRVKYQKPPILEAIVEFLFDEATPDPAVGGRYYEATKGECLHRDQFQTQQVVFQFGSAAGPPPPAPPLPSERLWLSKKPGLALQVGAGLLSVHFVRNPPLPGSGNGQPYPGFDWFVPHVENAVARYRNLVAPKAIKQVSMRYINKIDVPLKADGSSEDWLQTGLELPAVFRDPLRQFQIDLSIDLDGGSSDLRYLMRAGSAGANILPIWLDLRVASRAGNAPSFEALSAWLLRAHEEGIIKYFEGSITQPARDHFEVIHAAP